MDKSLILDLNRCVGCGACVVTCMDQNDIYPEKGQPAFRRIYQIEDSEAQTPIIQYVSAGCMHCQDSPCMTGCPTGAIYRDEKTGAVLVEQDRCIGCHSCALACPFGVPRYDADDKMHKCNLCVTRQEAGMPPACVKVCPYEALRFEAPNNIQSGKETKYISSVVSAVHKTKA